MLCFFNSLFVKYLFWQGPQEKSKPCFSFKCFKISSLFLCDDCNHDIGNGFFEYVRATRNGPLDCKRITYTSTLYLLVFCAFLKSNNGSMGTLDKQVQRSYSTTNAPILWEIFRRNASGKIVINRTNNF